MGDPETDNEKPAEPTVTVTVALTVWQFEPAPPEQDWPTMAI
jgi:hypothetical protein